MDLNGRSSLEMDLRLHSFVFPHLQAMLAAQEERLVKALRSYGCLLDLLKAIPGGDHLHVAAWSYRKALGSL